MAQARDFLVRNVQLVAFTASGDFDSSRVLTTVLSTFSKDFSGRVEVLPFSEEVPAEIPRVELGSKDGTFALSAAPARTSVAWVEREGSGLSAEQLAAKVEYCSKVLSCCFADSPVRVNRLGFIVTNVFLTTNPAQQLIQQFCDPRCHAAESELSPLRNSQGFQLHNFKAYPCDLDVFPINSWVRCMSGALASDGSIAMIVEQDLNTASGNETDRQFGVNEIRSYFTKAVPEAQKILSLYFPD